MRIVQLPVSVREIIRPLGRMVIFVVGAGAALLSSHDTARVDLYRISC